MTYPRFSNTLDLPDVLFHVRSKTGHPLAERGRAPFRVQPDPIECHRRQRLQHSRHGISPNRKHRHRCTSDGPASYRKYSVCSDHLPHADDDFRIGEMPHNLAGSSTAGGRDELRLFFRDAGDSFVENLRASPEQSHGVVVIFWHIPSSAWRYAPRRNAVSIRRSSRSSRRRVRKSLRILLLDARCARKAYADGNAQVAKLPCADRPAIPLPAEYRLPLPRALPPRLSARRNIFVGAFDIVEWSQRVMVGH